MIKKLNNVIVPFILNEYALRGKIVKLSSSVDEIIKKHGYPYHIAKILAKILVAASIIGDNFKAGILTMQIKSEGIANLIIADYFYGGKIRGYISFDQEKYDKIKDDKNLEFQNLVGKGILAVTIDQGEGTELYQSIINISDNFEKSLDSYFTQSEQTKTSFQIFAEEEQGVWNAGGIMIQKLPEQNLIKSEDDNWDRIKLFISTVSQSEILDQDIEPGILIYRLFHDEEVLVYDAKSITHGCRCSRERAINILKSLSDTEIESLKENDQIDVTCKFCSHTEIFDQKFIDKIKDER